MLDFITNPVILSVTLMVILCLLKVNVMLSILISAIFVGVITPLVPVLIDGNEVLMSAALAKEKYGILEGGGHYFKEGIQWSINTLIDGMSGNSKTALSYILLGALAVAIEDSGLAGIIGGKIDSVFGKRGKLLLFVLAGIACLSQNVVPIHIAFIPILIPPLLSTFNKLKLDRRAVACALTFGLVMPYIAIPAGFGKIYHGLIADNMTSNGMAVEAAKVWKYTTLPALLMLLSLLFAIFVMYRKPREYKDVDLKLAPSKEKTPEQKVPQTTRTLTGAALGAISAFLVQLYTGSLPLGAIVALIIMLAFGTIPIKRLDDTVRDGVKSLGFIAFVMLVAAGYGDVIRETGAVKALVESISSRVGTNTVVALLVMNAVALFITMGIGTSFGTIPIIATIFVPLCIELNLSVPATICFMAAVSATGDAGSPASDSTLGPTSGLDVDGQHDHIRDTCIPTFIVFNIPLIIASVVGALIFNQVS